MLTLAVSQLVPKTLPAPGLIDLFIFERPELFLILQLICAAVMLWRVNQRGMLRRLWFMPLICVVIGGAVYVVGSSVETVRERLMRQTGEFVDALVAQDTAAVEKILSAQLVVERVPIAANREALIAAMSHRYVADITDYSVNVKGGVKDNANAGRTQAAISATVAGLASTSVPAVFEFAWRRTPEGEWVMTKLTMLRQPL